MNTKLRRVGAVSAALLGLAIAAGTTSAAVAATPSPSPAPVGPAALRQNISVVPSAAGLSDPSIPKLAAPKCAAGQTPVRASAAGKTRDGGFVYDFVIDGITNRAPVPPATFSPATATATQLAEYGFAARPTDSAKLTAWTARAAAFKGVPLPQTCKTSKMNLPASDVSASSTPAELPTSDTATSGNWEGVVAYNANANWQVAEGDYIQQTSHVCPSGCSATDTDESSWTGIGGWSGEGLIQDGTDMSGTPLNGMYAWYEYLHHGASPPELAMNELSVSPGMSISTLNLWDPSTNTASFEVCAGGYCGSRTVTLDPTYYEGHTVEAIDERPTWATSDGTHFYKPLSDFVANGWTQLYGRTPSTWYGMPSVPAWAVTMINTSGQALANPTGYTTTGFNGIWDQAQ